MFPAACQHASTSLCYVRIRTYLMRCTLGKPCEQAALWGAVGWRLKKGHISFLWSLSRFTRFERLSPRRSSSSPSSSPRSRSHPLLSLFVQFVLLPCLPPEV